MTSTVKSNIDPAHIELAKMFSSVKIMGPPMSEKLVELISHIFSPDEARLCRHLSFIHPKSVDRIARLSGRRPDAIAPILNDLSRKRIIIAAGTRFMLYPLIPGAFEYILMTGGSDAWHNKYAELANDIYNTGYMKEYFSRPVKALRNIPVQRAVENKSFIADSDLISELIDSHKIFAVLNACPCRQSMHLTGHTCDRASPKDGCLVFGDYASAIETNKSGRLIKKKEMIDTVAERWEKKLVFLTSNVVPSAPTAVCTCCDCCCHALGIHNHLSKNLIAASHCIADVDESMCNNCGKCVEVCNTHAHYLHDKKHGYNPGNCVGCGNCVMVCKNGAITIMENPLYRPPHRNYKRLIVSILPPVILMGAKIKLMRYFKRTP
jgi:NAD-dependent dihydropyrimidine dehydrogenase PreA subunit